MLRRLVLGFALAGVGIVAASLARASVEMTEGSPPFYVVLFPEAARDTNGTWQLVVRTEVVRRDGISKGTLRIGLGEGISLVEGDTVQTVDLRSGYIGRLKVRGPSDHRGRILGSLTVAGRDPGSSDFCEQALEVEARTHQVVTTDNYMSRCYHMDGGRRFRYGGKYLVAVDADEQEIPRQIVSHPKPTQRLEIECADCGLKSPVEVRVVVTVSSAGKVSWARPDPLAEGGIEGSVWAAIKAGLVDYRFTPAMSTHGPVADGIVLTARVFPKH